MRATAIAALAVALALGAAAPAGAATTKKRVVEPVPTQRVMAQQVTTRRAPARIVVRRRSSLDPGTEVLPGSQNYTDYVYPRTYSPWSSVSPVGLFGGPLPDPFWLPSNHAPGYGY